VSDDSDEQKSPVDKLLDLLVYGPAGLAMTAAEEFPKLVEKGRHRVDGQLHAARLVGQFAVQMGRRQLESVLGGIVSGPDAPAPSPAQSSPHGAAGPATQDPVAPEAPDVVFSGSENGALASDALGIPGYDSLSASQVVQRLGGLSDSELEAIRDHELAHRHRQTILNRVEQLLTSEPGDA
jgi:hypothetical protein